jgi:hypothetical protein
VSDPGNGTTDPGSDVPGYAYGSISDPTGLVAIETDMAVDKLNGCVKRNH